MDLGKISDELQDLIEIEKILIVQIFPVISVYRLYGGQHEYHENIINFS